MKIKATTNKIIVKADHEVGKGVEKNENKSFHVPISYIKIYGIQISSFFFFFCYSQNLNAIYNYMQSMESV